MTNEMTNEMQVVKAGEVAEAATGIELLKGASNGNNFLTSITDDGSREKKIAIYNAINNAEEKIDDHKGEVLEIVDFVAHPVNFIADETGEIVEALRIVLIDKNGKGYETVASGVLSSLQKMFGIVGMPTWEPALKVIPREQKTRKGFKTLTLDLAE